MRSPLWWIPLVGVFLAPSPAVAADPCPKLASCGTITVPLDHSNVVSGTLPLAYARIPARRTYRGTIVVLTGGPGVSAINSTMGYRRVLRDVRPGYDLVFVDQRGTGRSGAVECGEIRRLPDITACGERLGARRAFFTTRETARDVEDLRRTLGADRLTLLGISYGPQVAAEYARTF